MVKRNLDYMFYSFRGHEDPFIPAGIDASGDISSAGGFARQITNTLQELWNCWC